MMCFGVKDRKPARTNHCVIVLLDDTQLVHELHPTSTGQDLLDVVIKHLNLLETSYFGLRYLEPGSNNSNSTNYSSRDARQQQQISWLDVNKSAIKQLSKVQPMTVYFGVKYYALDPCKLAEEITRYQFFLQCKQDILQGRLQINFELAVELFALAVQSELGDYDPQRHLEGYVSEFQFLVNQTHELEKRVSIYHRSLCGQVPATAELNFLERVKWLDLYGVQMFPIQYDDESGAYEDYCLGLNPSGVLVLRNKARVAHYLWPRIVKTKCQGRCFLMDVIQQQQPASGKAAERNRFGFRLADKEAARKLAWAIDEHRSFHLLLHSSSARGLNQAIGGGSMKLSQRFRNSIRSAIGVGGPFGGAMQMAQQQQQQFQLQHQKLRASTKSMNPSAAESRQQPTVVRMPSRRYGTSRSSLAGNGSGSGSGRPQAHTMVESQRQQAMLMMSQLNQMGAFAGLQAGKSQTLKPTNRHPNYQANELKRNPYYQQLMMMLAAQQQQQQHSNQPDIAILPPGRHVVQPAIYKASSVINGINQLPGGKPMQFFNNSSSQQGHESPRSTKSAIAPSSALKLASKKLAKQHQLALYNNRNNQLPDAQPLLAFEQQQYANYYANSTSANQSPRSVRSNRMRHRSKSSQNLNQLQQQMAFQLANSSQQEEQLGQLANSKMLLATTHQMMSQNLLANPPPPAYNTSGSKMSSARQAEAASCMKTKRSQLADQQAALLLNTNGLVQQQRPNRKFCSKYSDDDDYCCSRSDCSSVNDREAPLRRGQRCAGETKSRPQVQPEVANSDRQQEDWNAIRRRHSEFSSGKGNFSNLLSSQFNTNKKETTSSNLDSRRQPLYSPEQEIEEQLVDTNNNNSNCQQVSKSIAKPTPILLSMNELEGGSYANNNNRAVELLNLQRQQLNHTGSSSPEVVNGSAGSNKMAPPDSTASSAASSPQTNKPNGRQQSSSASSTASQPGSKTFDSGSSATSGYYAASNNSTGSASLDSDGQPAIEQANRRIINRRTSQFVDDWPEEGTRAKIALSTARLAGNRLVIGNKAALSKHNNQDNSRNGGGKQQKQFYLGEPPSEPAPNPPDQVQWANQANNSSLKYVSFDV